MSICSKLEIIQSLRNILAWHTNRFQSNSPGLITPCILHKILKFKALLSTSISSYLRYKFLPPFESHLFKDISHAPTHSFIQQTLVESFTMLL